MNHLRNAHISATLGFVAALATACVDDGGGRNETGSSCAVAAECFPNVVDGGLLGDPLCLDRVEGGYCTHTCSDDAECCAVSGECSENHYPEVCAPFESTGGMYCFLSCEDRDDGNAFCATYAHRDFICRSTGGGALNRKVCVPEGR